jgi:hypothetical protein
VYQQVASFVKHLTTSVSQQHSTIHQAFPSSSSATAVGSTTSLSRRQESDGQNEQSTKHPRYLSGSTIQAEKETPLENGKVAAPEITASPQVSHSLPLPQVDADAGNDPQSKSHSRSLPTYLPLLRAERVSIHGVVRPMSPDALRIPEDGVGVVKAAPVKRWLTGQNAWDAKYKRIARGVEKERAGWEKKAMEVMRRAGLSEEEIEIVWQQKTGRNQIESRGNKSASPTEQVSAHTSGANGTTLETIPELDNGESESVRAERMRSGRRWGPLDLAGETPPPSAIAGRLDTPDAVDLLKTSLSYIPRTEIHRRGPNKVKQGVDRVLRGSAEPVRPRRQSAAEQQVPANPLHGVRLWGGMMG